MPHLYQFNRLRITLMRLISIKVTGQNQLHISYLCNKIHVNWMGASSWLLCLKKRLLFYTQRIIDKRIQWLTLFSSLFRSFAILYEIMKPCVSSWRLGKCHQSSSNYIPWTHWRCWNISFEVTPVAFRPSCATGLKVNIFAYDMPAYRFSKQ